MCEYTKNYCERLRASLTEKLFFQEWIFGHDLVIDFGCADGTMIAILAEHYPNVRFIGYDTNPKMVELAQLNTLHLDNVTITQSSANVMFQCGAAVRAFVYGSSVHHELDADGWKEWKNLCDRADTIAVRDFHLRQSKFEQKSQSEKAYKALMYDLPSDDFQYFDKALRAGRLKRVSDVLDITVKLLFKENFDKEMEERYFNSYHPHDFVSNGDRWRVVYERDYVNDFLDTHHFKLFGKRWPGPSHKQLIMQKL